MDKEVLQTKIEALIRCIHRIKDQNISSLEELEANVIGDAYNLLRHIKVGR